MPTFMRRVTVAAVLLLAGLGLGRAALSRFREQEQAFRKGCQQQLQALGITRQAAKAKFPTPEISLISSACLLPGGTGEVVVKGKFMPQTKFVFENDSFTVVKENLTATEYRATLKVAEGIGPQTAALSVISPVTCITRREDNAVGVGGRFEWTMEAANGWKVVARSAGASPCGGRPRSENPYELLFYRKGESAPFEKREAKLYFSMYERANHRFTMSRNSAESMPGMAEMKAIAQKMSNPGISNAERQQLMAEMQKAQAAMAASMDKLRDPAYRKKLEEKEQQFGCERIEMEVAPGGAIQGRMRCAAAVGTQIALTGSMKFLGQ